jgi:hypothetical protein
MDTFTFFYVTAAVVSIAAWVVALFRVNRVFTGQLPLFIGKVLMIVTLMQMDFIIITAFLQIIDREAFRLGMIFLMGIQIVAAISVATGRQRRGIGTKK